MIKGFSKLSKKEKQALIVEKTGVEPQSFQAANLTDKELQQLIEQFSENALGIYPFPFGIAPNFLVDGQNYFVPMVTEESSVVAAASKSASYWNGLGGFKTKLIGDIKTGQIHFTWNGNKHQLRDKIQEWQTNFLASIEPHDEKMKKRGGGVQKIELVDCSTDLPNYFQLNIRFKTMNAMGANYMNTCLETIATGFEDCVRGDKEMEYSNLNVVMSILSNYSPENAVKVWVETEVEQLVDPKIDLTATQFANKFVKAVEIAQVNTERAVTHNKGFYNGVDAVALATGNDWRAIEANGHAYSVKSGKYSSISEATINNNIFCFQATVPLQVGTVGGITALHPMAKLAMQILGNPSAYELMRVMAAVGLASNFAAVKSLITSGIQKGHMKMHLSNIIRELGANNDEASKIVKHFSNQTVSRSAVESYFNKLKE